MSDSTKYWKKPKAPHTKVKTAIAHEYFLAWASIMKARSREIAYLDLYAGNGRHKNGEPSTALRIIESASKDSDLRSKLRIILNDIQKSRCANMLKVIAEEAFNNQFITRPMVSNSPVDQLLADKLLKAKFRPTFCLIDPYGFKGLSINLIEAVIKDWGCDCLLFFHTSGINRNLMVPNCVASMEQLFGSKYFAAIRKEVESKKTNREALILETFRQATAEVGCKHFRELRFNRANSTRISHHIVLLTKSDIGFRIGKSVMAKYSQLEDGIPKYVYTEGCEDAGDQLSIPGIGGAMQELKDILVAWLCMKSHFVSDIVKRIDSEDLRYTERNVKQALLDLEEENIIIARSSSNRARRKGTMGDKVLVERSPSSY